MIKHLRKIVQAGWGLLSNGYIKGFLPGAPRLYTGALKHFCVPGLNCYSCPGALGACPIGALQAVCKAEGTKLHHVKPHGAMYNMAAKDEKLADAIAEAVAAVDGSLTLVGLSGSCLKAAAEKHGLAFAAEVFADRAYEDDGSLVSRTKPGAMIEDEDLAIRRMLHLLETGTIESSNGKEIRLEADTICVHGDSPKAVLFAKKLREALDARIAAK